MNTGWYDNPYPLKPVGRIWHRCVAIVSISPPCHGEYGHPFHQPHTRDYAVRDYKTTLKVVHLAKPSSVNLALAAIDHFYCFLELPTPQVTREDLPAQAPRALETPEQKRFLRAVERCASARDRTLLLFYTILPEWNVLSFQPLPQLRSEWLSIIARIGEKDTWRSVSVRDCISGCCHPVTLHEVIGTSSV